jgi:hypothetical protein
MEEGRDVGKIPDRIMVNFLPLKIRAPNGTDLSLPLVSFIRKNPQC